MGDQDELAFKSFNEDKAETIVLLHGVLSCHLEYQYVIPYLSSYHVIAVDLNGHSGSRNILPVTPAASAANVAALIKKHAHGGKAHVVGLSFGGFTGLKVAQLYPEQVRSLFVTGAAPFEGLFKWMAERPGFVWFIMKLSVRWVPDWLYWKLGSWRGLKRHEDLYAEMKGNMVWENIKSAYTGILSDLTWEDVKQIRVRTVTVASGLDDDVPCTARMGKLLPAEGSKGVLVKKAVHSWDLQFPELFSKGVLAWVAGEELPAEFEPLESKA
jgi:pimeloyl-ACP methyl ester carboxylesterase